MPLKKPKNFLPLPPPFNQQSSAQPSSLKRPGISQMGGGQRQVLVVEGLMTEEQVGSAQKGLGLELGGLRAEGEGPAPLAGEAHQEVDGTCSGLNTAVAPLKAEHSARKALSISDTHNRHRATEEGRAQGKDQSLRVSWTDELRASRRAWLNGLHRHTYFDNVCPDEPSEFDTDDDTQAEFTSRSADQPIS
uniref:Uncharacterized protein n=1 Tax=Mus musculus TaxID=10090 RepID=Q3UZ54_MOUSE|nr:unnamed protein product [Mus musculus]